MNDDLNYHYTPCKDRHARCNYQLCQNPTTICSFLTSSVQNDDDFVSRLTCIFFISLLFFRFLSVTKLWAYSFFYWSCFSYGPSLYTKLLQQFTADCAPWSLRLRLRATNGQKKAVTILFSPERQHTDDVFRTWCTENPVTWYDTVVCSAASFRVRFPPKAHCWICVWWYKPWVTTHYCIFCSWSWCWSPADRRGRRRLENNRVWRHTSTKECPSPKVWARFDFCYHGNVVNVFQIRSFVIRYFPPASAIKLIKLNLPVSDKRPSWAGTVVT